MLAIRLPHEIEMRLSSLASKTGRTKTYYARKAILELIEDMEDAYLALERLLKSQIMKKTLRILPNCSAIYVSKFLFMFLQKKKKFPVKDRMMTFEK